MRSVISLGAGVQSSTVALMCAEGLIQPMPEAAIFADTQAETDATYQWLDKLERLLPFPLIRVSRGSLEAEIYADATKQARFMLPAFTDAGGMGRRQCTRRYKIRVVRHAAVNLLGAHRTNPFRQLMGISLDEVRRIKPSGVRYLVNSYPLVDLRMTRGHCLEFLRSRGHQVPRSACVFCPYADFSRLTGPELVRAIGMDSFIRDRGGTPGVRQYLHPHRQPLATIPLERLQAEMFDHECAGVCGT